MLQPVTLNRCRFENVGRSVSISARCTAPMERNVMVHSANHYRRRAAELRDLAALVSDPMLSEQLSLVAQDYEELAEGEIDPSLGTSATSD
jgi:hypothetical protein